MNNKADKIHSILHIFISSIYAHFIFICLVIFCFLFMSCGRASAAGSSDTATFYDYIHNITDAWPVSDRSAFNTALDSKITSDYYFVTNGSDYIIFSKKPSLGLISQYSHYQYAAKCVGFNNVLYPDWQDSFPFYIFQTFRGGSVLCEVYDFQAGMNVSPMRFSWTGNYYYNITDFGYSYTDNFTYSGTWYGNVDTFYEIFGSSGTGYSYGWSVSSLPVERPRPAYIEDERLKFSTFSLPSGGYYLQTDIRQFGFDNIDGSSASQQIILDNNSIDLTFVCDEEVYEITLDSSNSVISSDYIFSTEYSSLFNFDDFDSIYIDKAEFTQVIRYRVSEQRPDEYVNYKIDCEYYLKQPVPPVAIEDIEYDEDTDSVKVTQGEINERNEVINHDNGVYSLEYPGENELVVPDGFTVKIITVSADSSLADMLNSLDAWNMLVNPIGTLYDLGEASVLNVVGIDSTDEFNEFMDEDIKANAYGLYYDIVCYYWTPAPSTGEVDSFYYYFTASGKIRTSNQILADIWVETNQTSYNTSAIYDYLYSRLNDFEYQCLESFANMIDLDVGRNNWLATIDLDLLDGLSDVVDAVNSIEFDFVPFDDSDILSALSSISLQLSSILGLDNNEDDTVSEAIAYYQSHNSGGLPTQDVYLDNKMSLWMSGKVHVWLQGSSVADSRQGLLIDSFDFMTQFFDSLQSHGLIVGVRNYVRSFTSGTSSGSAETVYKTIWTGSFNPNLKDGE